MPVRTRDSEHQNSASGYPHHFIFNRFWYKHEGGRPEFEEYQSKMSRLSVGERRELLEMLSSVDPKEFEQLGKRTANRAIQDCVRHYAPLAKEKEAKLWAKRANSKAEIPDDERVEDAGLSDSPLSSITTTEQGQLTLV